MFSIREHCSITLNSLLHIAIKGLITNIQCITIGVKRKHCFGIFFNLDAKVEAVFFISRTTN